MTTATRSTAGAPSASSGWAAIDWRRIRKHVQRLQMRIAKAAREGRWGKVKALQWLLSHAYSAKLLAVRRVVSNSGRNTAGVDREVWTTPGQKLRAARSLQRRGYRPLPLRRLYIPKKQSGKLRPLSIPCMSDRAMQALYLLGLEPVSETMADRNAYGFRPKRSAADAIEQCFKVLARKHSASWISEGDIKACFDRISHTWLMDHIPMDKSILRKWLAAGYMEEGIVHPTEMGTPQGGIASPTLAIITLTGLEAAVKRATKGLQVNVVVYADDFIITGPSREALEGVVKPAVEAFLKERGLELSEEKTRITHIDDGFDFLGFNVRKYEGKLLIKRAKQSVKAFLVEIRRFIKANTSTTTAELIRRLNQKIRGWANYYRHVVAKEIFQQVDNQIYRTLIGWVNRRHPKKLWAWKCRRYFRARGQRHWVFFASVPAADGRVTYLDLFRADSVPVIRHIKIQGTATPYDPAYHAYFARRAQLRRVGRHHWRGAVAFL